MMTYNEQRAVQKEFDAPRYYSAPMIQQLYVLIANQLHPLSISHQNSHLVNPGHQQHDSNYQGLLQNYQQSSFGLQAQQQSQYLATHSSDHVFDQNTTYMPVQAMQSQSGQNMGPYPSSQMHSSYSQMTTLNRMVGMNQIAHVPTSQILGITAAPPPRSQSTHQAFIERLQGLLPVPPLSRAATRPDVAISHSHKRPKRKSKFTKRQDEMIVHLKKEGRTWVEIAEMVGVGSYLAARNRYQVIVGQQGNNNSLSWTCEDRDELQKLLDSAELDKWRYIAQELSKATGKKYTTEECREYACLMFWKNPAAMGVTQETIIELQKEKRITERLLQQPAKADYDYLKRYNRSPELSI